MFKTRDIGLRKTLELIFLLELSILKKLISRLGFLITFEIEGNLNSATYLDLLVTKVGPALEEVARENQEICFQQDGCPAHFGPGVRIFLNYSFPNCWIGRGGAINWPARSPDLAPCEFFLWGHLKSKIYKRRHPDINSLREELPSAP
jgi:hypothetical protein